jgi:hypothetical protein
MLKETIERAKKKSPPYFVKLQVIATTMVAIAGTLIALNSTGGIVLNEQIVNYLTIFIAVMGGIGITAKLPVKQ